MESSNILLIIQPLPLTCSLSRPVLAKTFLLLHRIKSVVLILLQPSDVIRKVYGKKGTFLKKDSCFMNQISLRTLQKKALKGALDGQKEPRVDRSFFVKNGKQKMAVFVA
jgi:hypothetical protein